MVDNVAITAGTGTTIAADDIAGVLHQRVKIGIGADGSATDLAFGQGTKTASLPVTLASNDDSLTKLDTINTSVGTVNTSVGTVNTSIGTMSAKLPASLGTKTISNAMAVSIASDQTVPVSVASVVGSGSGSWTTWSRPADTAAYAAGDVVGSSTSSGGAILTMANMGPSGSEIIITGVKLRIDITAVVSGMTGFRLHLYKATIPSVLGDNAVFDVPSGDRSVYAGYIDFDTPADLGSTLFQQVNGLQVPIKLSGTSLFCYLQTLTAWTPASASGFGLMINAVPA